MNQDYWRSLSDERINNIIRAYVPNCSEQVMTAVRIYLRKWGGEVNEAWGTVLDTPQDR